MNKNKNISVTDILCEPPKVKKIFQTTTKTMKKPEKKTILDFMFDTESGVAMKDNEDFTDQVDVTNRLFTDTPHTSMLDMRKSRKDSLNNNLIIDNSKKDFIGLKRENEESQLSKKSVKPQIIIENGVIRLERPNFIEVRRKVNEDIRQGNERNLVSVDMTYEKVKLSSLSFRKRSSHSDKWTEEETELFYKSLDFFGTDFSLLEMVLKPRPRNQIKNKFHKEEKVNSSRIESSLKNYKVENVTKFFEFIKELKKRRKKYEEIDFKKIFSEDFNWQLEEENKDLPSDSHKDEEDNDINKEEDEEEDDDDNLTVSDH